MKLIGIQSIRVGIVAVLVAGLLAGCTSSGQQEANASTPTLTAAKTPVTNPSTPKGPEASLDQSKKLPASKCGNGGKGVLLVFDDFPLSKKLYKQLIDTAKKSDAGIGVAPNGSFVRSGRVDVNYAREKGMLVVDHAFDHLLLTSKKLSYKKLVWEITQPDVGSNIVRPPYGAVNATVRKALKDHGKRLCLWNLDPEDWNHKSPKAAADYIIKHAFAGATAVVHMNHLGTQPKLIPYIQKGLAKRGLKLCRPWSTPTPKKMPNRYC